MINEGHLKQFFPNFSSTLVFICELNVLYLVFFHTSNIYAYILLRKWRESF